MLAAQANIRSYVSIGIVALFRKFLISRCKACVSETCVVQPCGLVLQSVPRPADFLWQIARSSACDREKSKERVRMQRFFSVVFLKGIPRLQFFHQRMVLVASLFPCQDRLATSAPGAALADWSPWMTRRPSPSTNNSACSIFGSHFHVTHRLHWNL